MSGRIFLVSVGAYEHDLFSLGARASLEDGVLHLYVARGWLPRTWTDRTSTRFTIDGRRLPGAIDGEPATLDPPLEFRIEPRALRVLVPPG